MLAVLRMQQCQLVSTCNTEHQHLCNTNTKGL